MGEQIPRIKKELFCQWCGHKGIYDVSKYNQPLCHNCGRNIKK